MSLVDRPVTCDHEGYSKVYLIKFQFRSGISKDLWITDYDDMNDRTTLIEWIWSGYCSERSKTVTAWIEKPGLKSEYNISVDILLNSLEAIYHLPDRYCIECERKNL